MQLSLLAPPLGGCADEFSNAPFEDDARFVAAAPSGAELRIGLGGAVGLPNAAVDINRLAQTYVTTRRVSLQLNALAFGLLRDVDDLIATPPAERTAGRRLWLPTPGALDPVESSFEMSEDGEGGFVYELAQARRGEGGPSVSVMTGQFQPDEAGGRGALTLDLSAAAAVSGGPERGRVHVTYKIDRAAGVDARTQAALLLEIRFEGVSFDGEPPSQAEYAYTLAASGEGIFDFALTDERGRLVELRSRWLTTGAGRADIRVTEEGGGPTESSECWGGDFRQVYAESPEGSIGDPEACAYPDASPPGSALR